jgi:hypothetical protein
MQWIVTKFFQPPLQITKCMISDDRPACQRTCSLGQEAISRELKI